MKVCLIRLPIVIPRNNMTTMFTPPLGVAYLAGALCAAGHEVQVIDGLGEGLDERHDAPDDCVLVGLSLEEVVDRIDPGTGVIGMAAGFSFEWPTCRRLAGMVRERFPEALLVGGGEHITAMPGESLDESALDVGVLGEGEEILVELVAGRQRGDLDLGELKGVVFRSPSGELVETERHQRIKEIDDIPLPAWHLMPIENYLDRGLGFGVNRGRSMPVMASRGCPYQCTFCSSPAMWTTRWIARDVDLLIDEMADYQERYGVTNFDFYDLTAIVKRSWIIEFCQKIEERGLSFTWQLPSGTRSEAIDSEVAQLLYRSGCRNLSYSPESGSPSVLKRIKKNIKVDRMIESVSGCVRAGLNVKYNIIFGFPGETMREVWQSYRFIARMALAGAHDLSIWAFSPYPGTELFEQLRASQGLGTGDDYYDSLRAYSDVSQSRSYSDHISDGRLKILRRAAVIMFYVISWTLRPIRPIRFVVNVLTGREESRGEMALANLMRANISGRGRSLARVTGKGA